MSEIDNGGPAFPFVQHEGWTETANGMTLRDYFAAKAMQGLMATTLTGSKKDFARHAYQIADAMLAARNA